MDEKALLVALEEGRVAGAGLDVFAREPCTDSPLFALDRVVATPHLGASTDEAQENAGNSVARSVRLALAGELVPDAVNVSGGVIAQEVRPGIALVEKLGRVFTAVVCLRAKEEKFPGQGILRGVRSTFVGSAKIRLVGSSAYGLRIGRRRIDLAIPRGSRNLQMLSTGGGARNKHLVEVLRGRLLEKAAVVLPPDEIIDFKEAIIFAFLGLLRLRQENNVLRSVTRSRQDSSSGVLIGRWTED